MAKYPAMPLFTDAYLGDTTHLTTAQHGAYMLLLIASWRSPSCSLPDDDLRLSRTVRMDMRTWKRNRPTLQEFFEVANGEWRQKKLRDTMQKVCQLSNKKSAAGKASALKRKNTGATGVVTNGQQNGSIQNQIKKINNKKKEKGGDEQAQKARAFRERHGIYQYP